MTSQKVETRPWYRITNAAPRVADVDIFDEIGWETTAAQFTKELRDLDVDTIRLHVNSPGGDVFQGVAILNALRAHPARVVATVEGIAASAASFITMAGDEVVMARNSEMMIHDAAGVAMGNATTMTDLAQRLDKVSNNIASIYAERAGGTVEQWRDAMRAETWYSAEEAVEAGLADRVDTPVPADEVVKAKARFDLSIYNYAGRASAPPPAVPRDEQSAVESQPITPAVEVVADPLQVAEQAPALPAPTTPVVENASGSTTRERGAGMDPAKLREAVGLPADASDEDVKAKLADAGLVNAAPPEAPVIDTPSGAVSPAVLKQRIENNEVVVVDPSVIADLQKAARLGQEAHRKLLEQECDDVLNKAIAAGKFPPARREHWKAAWQADPEGTRQQIENLAPGLVPVDATGYLGKAGEEYQNDLLYSRLFPEGV